MLSKKLTKYLRKHQRLFWYFLALCTALAFGLPAGFLTMSGPGTNEVGKVYGKLISREAIEDIRIRWKSFSNLFLRQRYPRPFETEDYQAFWDNLPADSPVRTQYATFDVFHLSQYFSLPNLPPFNLADYHLWWSDKKEEYYNNLARTVVVLLAQADQLNIKIALQQVRKTITGLFSSRETGGFDVNNYRMTLSQLLRMNEADFARSIEELLKIFSLIAVRQQIQFPLSIEVFQEYLSANEEIKIRWAVFTPDDYRGEASAHTPEEIERFFKDNPKNYEINSKVQIEYLLADKEEIKKKLPEPTSAEIQKEYEQTRENYRITPVSPTSTAVTYKPLQEVYEEVKSKKKESDASIKAIEAIGAVNERIKELLVKGKAIDLAQLAIEFGLKYGQTGFFSKDRIDEIAKEIGSSPAFEQQVWDYPENIPSQAMSSDKGEFIFRLLKKKAGYLPPLTLDIKEKVTQDLTAFKSKQLAESEAREAQTEIIKFVTAEVETALQKPPEEREKITLSANKKYYEQVLKAKGKEINQSGWIKPNDSITKLPDVGSNFTKRLFKLKNGEIDSLEERGNYYLVQALEHRSPGGDDFDTQKTTLEAQVWQKQVNKFLKEWQGEIKVLISQFKQ